MEYTPNRSSAIGIASTPCRLQLRDRIFADYRRVTPGAIRARVVISRVPARRWNRLPRASADKELPTTT